MLKLLCFTSGLSRRAAVSGVVPVVYSLVLANNLQNNHFSNFMYMNDWMRCTVMISDKKTTVSIELLGLEIVILLKVKTLQ